MTGVRWLRLLAIATAAVILASCRSLTAPLATSATAVTILPDDLVPRDRDHSLTAALAGDAQEPAALPTVPGTESLPAPPPPPAASLRRDERVVPVGLETPCPPLPRLACRDGSCGQAVGLNPRFAPGCRAGSCRGGSQCRDGGC
jgi:hypothetical protein